MSKKKTKIEKPVENLSIEIQGYDLDALLEQFIKEKLGDIEIKYMELCSDDKNCPHLLNADDNKFSIFLEYSRNK